MPDNTHQNSMPGGTAATPKKQTARISLENALNVNAADPKISTAPIPQTIRLKKPPTAPLFVKPPPPPPAARREDEPKSMTTVLRELPEDNTATAKRETSRIILRDVASTTGATDPKYATAPITGIPVSATGIPQTIRLKRPTTSIPAVKAPNINTTATTRARPTPPAPRAAPASEAPTVTRSVGAGRLKAETSRIVLDGVAAARPTITDPQHATAPIAGLAPAQPQTIRLKRPVDSPSIKTDMVIDTAEASKSQTAKIDLPSVAPDAGATSSITQRKTIKIKRTERNVMPHTLVLKRAATTPAATSAADEPSATAATEPEPAAQAETIEAPGMHWSFVAVAALALICAACLAYLTAAQAFGPELQLPVPAQLL